MSVVLRNIVRNALLSKPACRISYLSASQSSSLVAFNEPILISKTIVIQPVRYGGTGVFNRRSAADIWKSVTSVSSAGRKRGRGRGKKNKIRDLNRGQVIGLGKMNIRWPGLSAPVLRGKELVKQEQLPPDLEYQKNIERLRDTWGKAKRAKISPLDRGYTGSKLPGRKIGPPDPIGEDVFEGFETMVLELKPVYHMTAKFGRYRSVSCLAISGNKNGVIGIARGRAVEGKTAVKLAKNRSAQRLIYVHRYNEHTVMHDFYSRFCNTKVYVWKKPEGYGLKCHRIIKSACEIIGIRNLAAKIEGSTTPENVLRSFVLGLMRQKTHQELANETSLHVVELSPEHGNYPKVIASPTAVKTDEDDVPEFSRYVFDGNVYGTKYVQPPKISKFYSWGVVKRRIENNRGLIESKRQLKAEYDGNLRSFLSYKYDECKPHLPRWTRSLKEAEAAKESEDVAGS